VSASMSGRLRHIAKQGVDGHFMMGQLMGFLDGQKTGLMAHVTLFLFFFFSLFWSCIIVLYSYIFLFLYITKASSHLTPYRLKDKNGYVSYRLKNYVCIQILTTASVAVIFMKWLTCIYVTVDSLHDVYVLYFSALLFLLIVILECPICLLVLHAKTSCMQIHIYVFQLHCFCTEVRLGQLKEYGDVTSRQIGAHDDIVRKLALEPGSPHIFYRCGEDSLVQLV
jgi:hypothetical protein